jgi:hypothetical protein
VLPENGDFTSKAGKRMLAGLAGLLCTAALLFASTAPAGAATAAPGAGSEEMSLEFTRSTARVVGSGALVFVECTGSSNGLCTGTVTLALGTSKHKVPFSIVGGASQSLVVPLGSDKRAFGRSGGQTAVGVASTAQPLGNYVETTGVLHLK